MSLIEAVVAGGLLVVVLGATTAIVKASTSLAQSTNDAGVASNRATRALRTMATAVRRGSLATVETLDGKTLSPGATDRGFRIRPVLTSTVPPSLGAKIEYRLDVPAGAAEGSLVELRDGIPAVLADGVSSFSVSRTGNLFTLDVTTHSGPRDDRGRTVHAVLGVSPRNP
jgi:hypothetical protein